MKVRIFFHAAFGLFLLGAAQSASAVVYPIGTPVPSLCSFSSVSENVDSDGVSSVKEVCLARLVGTREAVIVLGLSDGTDQVYKIAQRRASNEVVAEDLLTYRLNLRFHGTRAGGQWVELDREGTASKSGEADLTTDLDQSPVALRGSVGGGLEFDFSDFDAVLVPAMIWGSFQE